MKIRNEVLEVIQVLYLRYRTIFHEYDLNDKYFGNIIRNILVNAERKISECWSSRNSAYYAVLKSSDLLNNVMNVYLFDCDLLKNEVESKLFAFSGRISAINYDFLKKISEEIVGEVFDKSKEIFG